MTVAEALAAALRLLARRDHSEGELAAKLRRQGLADSEIAAALARCRDLGYLDDERFAHQRAKMLMTSGRAVGGRLLLELRRQGIDESLAQRAIAAAGDEVDLDRQLRDLLDRRFAGFSYAQADDRQRRRVIHYFQRRGFPLSRILTTLTEER